MSLKQGRAIEYWRYRKGAEPVRVARFDDYLVAMDGLSAGSAQQTELFHAREVGC